jgi:penicillin-binding protein 1C
MNQPVLRPVLPDPAGSSSRRGLRLLVASSMALAGLALVASFVLGLLYIRFARSLPPADELRQRSASFRSTRIYDREGRLINETFDPNEGRRNRVPLDQISPYLIQATIATEDANFYEHSGVDPVAILRAVYYGLRERELVSGGSTIPQQLVKRVFLSPERTFTRKLKEAVLASEITRRYSKDEILELYLNEIFYGSLAYGCQSAAETFFGKPASDLDLAEATLLAGLPQAPAWYDPYSNPDRALGRQSVVLGLMVDAGQISREEAAQALAEPLDFKPLRFDMDAPHFTLFVRQQIEAITGDPAALYTRGLHVTTTLDRDLQAEAERIVAEQVDRLQERKVSNGALISMRPDSGDIIAFVGSKDFNDEAISGQVNMALAPRQPGSALKPFVYLTAFEHEGGREAERWTPGTLIPDIRTEFPDGANAPYVPVNYDGTEHGFVTVRAALANSYNIPAVAALQHVGLPAFIERMEKLGVTTLTRPDYGLSLALGGGELPLIELASAYAGLASGGRLTPARAILEIKDDDGTIICSQDDPDLPCLSPSARDQAVSRSQVVRPEDAFLISDMLSDNGARVPAFGPGSSLEIDRPAAVKTGTTNDFRDNWTMGYTPDLVTGVWVGNADNSVMQGTTGLTGAAPIWHDFMLAAHAGLEARAFPVPENAQYFEVCADTGTRPSEACPARANWYFSTRRPPLPADRDLWQILRIDRESGLIAGLFTPSSRVEERVYKVYPMAEGDANPFKWRDWAEAHGIPQPPRDSDQSFDFAPSVQISSPEDGATVSGEVEIRGTALVPGFERYELAWAESGSDDYAIIRKRERSVEDGTLGTWDTQGRAFGWHRIRLVVWDSTGAATEASIMLRVDNATATSTASPTGVETPTALATPTAVDTVTPGPTSFATAKPSPLPATLAPRPTVNRPPVGPPTSAPPTAPPPTTEPDPPTATAAAILPPPDPSPTDPPAPIPKP